MRDFTRLRVVVAVFSWALGGPIAYAQGQGQGQGSVSLTWDAPPECPGPSEVEGSVLRHLGRARGSEQPVAARAVVRRDGAEFALVLAVRIGDEAAVEREVRASRCTTLAETTALLVALAVDPQLAPEPDSADSTPPDEPAAPEPPSAGGPPGRDGDDAAMPSPSPDRTGATPGAAPRTISPEADDTEGDTDAPSEPWQWRLSIGAAITFDAGLLPRDPAFGVAPEVRFQAGVLLARAAVALWFPQTGELEGALTPRSQLETSALTASAHGCLAFDADAVALGPCAAIEYGEVDLRTIGIDRPEVASGRWFALGGGAFAQVRLPWGLLGELSATAYSPLARPRFFVMSDSGEVDIHTAAALDLRCSLGIAYVLRE